MTAHEASESPGQRIRDLIEQRAVEMGISLASLSRALGKNTSYMHHFLKRGTPRHLLEHDRPILAAKLRLPEDALMHPATAVAALTHTPSPTREDDVPAYYQTDEITPLTAREYVPHRIRPAAELIAIRMQTGRGRLEPGDLVYLAREPARIGDTVFVMRARRLAGWGRMMEAAEDTVTIETTSGSLRVPTGDADILRVVAISTA